MNRNKIESPIRRIINRIISAEISFSIKEIEKILQQNNIVCFDEKLAEIKTTYSFLLQYALKGIPDPQRDKVLKHIQNELLAITDELLPVLMEKNGSVYSSLRKQMQILGNRQREEALERFDEPGFDPELADLLKDTELSASVKGKTPAALSPELFNFLWLTNRYNDDDIELVRLIIDSDEVSWYDKSITAAALGLSLLDSYDKKKLLLLLEIYNKHEQRIWQPALTGVVFALVTYSKRITLDDELISELKKQAKNDGFIADVSKVLIQVYKARNTEQLSRKFNRDIMPDVQKFESKIRETFENEDLPGTDFGEDKNPDWEKVFEDNPELLEKIEKMSEMQMEGNDLFMGTFAQLKNFSFFNEMINWFRPFYAGNADAIFSLGDQDKMKTRFLESMENAAYICNSDKYSFCFNLARVPGEQQEKVMSLFNAESEAFTEMAKEDELLHKSLKDTFPITQYIQDLYRFYKLYPYRSEFVDPFVADWDISGTIIMDLLKSDPVSMRKIAEYLFGNESYDLAFGFFKELMILESGSQDLVEKVAYCEQKKGDFASALKYYKQAELFDANRLWNIRKMIFCSRKLGDNEEALKWCREAELLSPDDVYVQTMFGNIFLEKKMYSEALQHYLKADFLTENDDKLNRAVSWVYFMQDKYEQAMGYLQKIDEKNLTVSDKVHQGHCYLLQKNYPKAIEYYSVVPQDQLKTILVSEREILLSKGIEEQYLQWLEEYFLN